MTFLLDSDDSALAHCLPTNRKDSLPCITRSPFLGQATQLSFSYHSPRNTMHRSLRPVAILIETSQTCVRNSGSGSISHNLRPGSSFLPQPISSGVFLPSRSSSFNNSLIPHHCEPVGWWYLAAPPPTSIPTQPPTHPLGLTKQPQLILSNLAYKVKNFLEAPITQLFYESQGSMGLAAVP